MMNTVTTMKSTWLSCLSGMCMLCTFMFAGAADAVGPQSPIDVIIDSDMDSDDVAAITFLGQAHKAGLVNIKAVTVQNDGSNLPGIGLSQAKCVLDKIGLGNLPVGDSSVLLGVNQFPESIRGVLGKNDIPTAVGSIIETATGCEVATCDIDNDPDCTKASTFPQPVGNAVNLIKQKLDVAAPNSMTILTFGPLTDIATVVTANNGAYKSKIKAIYIMGGVTGAGNNTPIGNLCCGVDSFFTKNTPFDAGVQEFNIWGDPVSAQTVIREMSGKIYLTELRGSNWVPLSQSFRTKLGNNQNINTATEIVYKLASDPNIAPGGEADDGYGYLFWWDPLNAVAAIFNDVVTYTPNVAISVVQPKFYDGNPKNTKHHKEEGKLVKIQGSARNSGIVNDGTYVPSIDLNGNGMLDYAVDLDPSLRDDSYTGPYIVGNPSAGDEVANTDDKFHTYFLNVLKGDYNGNLP